ncbi:hypothetical protein WG901_01285 [Novosphingobium sp. PS1R-30]|uniref:Transporter n=1 Tax=Novosphingobium anseongense TaxID=3133436 RepID=A0ABU8RQ93_9SPHN
MNSARSYRGQPLVALIALLGGWVVLRVIVWETSAPTSAVFETARPVIAVPASREPTQATPRPSLPPPYAAQASRFVPPPAPPQPWSQQGKVLQMPRAVRSSPMPREAVEPVPVRLSAAHQLLWMAALSQIPLPAIASTAVTRPEPSPGLEPRAASPSRWSADGWLLLRRGGTVSPAGGFAPATYGASQVGAVVRYRLAPQSAQRPALYLRGSAALNGSREREAALGIAARPIAGLPVSVAAEVRVNSQPSGTRAGPAAFAYTEFAPVDLPLAARAEFYAQAGYVGGNFASAFADGQVRVDRRLVRLGRGELRAGAGIWGGAQKGASRLDVGPTAVVGLPIGERAGARLGVDWRFRIAGNAVPSSGPALTLSAGF